MILIQCRSTSERFPGKIMQPIDNVPMIRRVIDQARISGYPVMMLIPEDDDSKDYFRENDIAFFEGPEFDVLSRYYRAMKTYGLGWVCRITGDCPLISPAQIAFVIGAGRQHQADYASNCINECTDGQEVEYISERLMEHAYRNAKDSADREHVTTWIKKNQKTLEKDFRFLSYVEPVIGPKMSVDTPDDLANVIKMFQEMNNRKRLYV